jgi:hypothetical protein
LGLNIEDYYFVRLEKSRWENFSELELLLKDTKGVEVQHAFPYIGAIAAHIEDKKIVEELVQKGYIVEQQNKLLGLPEQP